MSTVTTAFEKAAAEGRAALVGYLPAGFPSVDGAIGAAVAMAEAGADVLEIGLPYSDPLMDGPVIQEATHRALAAGTRVTDVLRTVQAVAGTGVAVLVMTYWNPVDHYGVASFAADLAAAGGAGLITPDLPPEEAAQWFAAADKHGLDRVFLVAPSSSDERIVRITAACRGFVYAASLMGTTGARDAVGDGGGRPGRPGQGGHQPAGRGGPGGARRRAGGQVAGFADGVIVGSAFVQRLLAAPDEAAGLAAVRELTAELAAGVRSAARARG